MLSQGFSAALCRGLIEASRPGWRAPTPSFCFPRLYAAASLKHDGRRPEPGGAGRFPRLYAAASLKREGIVLLGGAGAVFSAALCRGLIEALA